MIPVFSSAFRRRGCAPENARTGCRIYFHYTPPDAGYNGQCYEKIDLSYGFCYTGKRKGRMMMLELHGVGCGYCHPPDFEIFRPEGSGDWLFLIFKSRTRVFLPTGEAAAAPGGVILYPPGAPQHYRAADSPWENDYLHFAGKDAGELAEKLALPLGQVIYPAGVEELMRRLAAIEAAAVQTPDLADIVADAEIRRLFLELHQAGEPPRSRHAAVLRQLRLEVYRTLGEEWSVERMAERVCLSPSHFFAEYRKLFGLSPIADLIGMRISLARYYLENTVQPVGAVAALAGFTNEYYFIRQFKRRTGKTPARYAREMREGRAKKTN